MKLPSININILLLIPSLLEIIDTSTFLVNIPGIPLSLGRLCFLLVGFINFKKIKYLKNNNIYIAFMLIILGMFLGMFFSPNLPEALSRTIAFSLLIFSAASISFSFRKEAFQYLVNFTMIGMFSYCTIYIVINLFSGNVILLYSDLYTSDDVMNHHVIGLRLSTSAIYLASYLISFSKTKEKIGYLLIIIAISLCLLIESRSNTLFTSIAGLILYLTNNKLSIKFFIITFPLLIIFTSLYINYVGTIDAISVRFNLSDSEYQTRTTQSRFLVIEQFFENFINYPFGKGIKNLKLDIGYGNRLLAHNQYLSFIIGGGIFGMIGVFIWIRNLINIFKLIFFKKWKSQLSKFESALVMSLITFSLTLLSIDVSGLYFLFMLSFAIYLISRYREIKLNLK
jgi:hypothetical protein